MVNPAECGDAGLDELGDYQDLPGGSAAPDRWTSPAAWGIKELSCVGRVGMETHLDHMDWERKGE